MPKATFEIPSDVKEIISRHAEINWDKIISDALWNYAKKIRLLETLTSKSKLTDKDVETIDHAIKAGLSKKYRNL